MSARYDRPTYTQLRFSRDSHVAGDISRLGLPPRPACSHCYRARRREVVAWLCCVALGGLAVAGWMLAVL